MALVNMNTVITTTLRTLKKCSPPGGVELLSYKRNRRIAIIKKSMSLVEIRENGYVEQIFETGLDTLDKELKTLVKREFPRSRKVRLVKFDDPTELERTYQKI